MIVGMWMTRDVVTATPDTPVARAAELMSRRGIRRLPVTVPGLHGPRLVGIVSATDIVRTYPPDVNPFAALVPDVAPRQGTVGEIMQHRPATTTPDTPVEAAAAIMRDLRVGALPVLRQDVLVGLITESDIFRAFVSLLASPAGGVRITFDTSRGEGVFSWVAQAAARRGLRVVSLLTAEQEGRPVCVVRIAGPAADEFLDDLWASGHHVLNVLHLE
jgi:acetoin utilization protein AcuB